MICITSWHDRQIRICDSQWAMSTEILENLENIRCCNDWCDCLATSCFLWSTVWVMSYLEQAPTFRTMSDLRRASKCWMSLIIDERKDLDDVRSLTNTDNLVDARSPTSAEALHAVRSPTSMDMFAITAIPHKIQTFEHDLYFHFSTITNICNSQNTPQKTYLLKFICPNCFQSW